MNNKVKIPERMSSLPLDERGYPIPFIVFRDDNNKPHFTINDEYKRLSIIKQDRCPICGEKLLRGRWFVGGPLSAFHPEGLYLDSGMHHECMNYAMQVCPYLAAPKYLKRISDKTVKTEDISQSRLFIDPTVIDARPDVFVAIMTTGQKLIGKGSLSLKIRPKKPCVDIQYWKYGKQIDKKTAKELIKNYVNKTEFKYEEIEKYIKGE